MSVDKFGRYSKRVDGVSKRGPPGQGFLLTSDGNFDLTNKRLKNLNKPEDKYDAVNKIYIEEHVERKISNFYLNNISKINSEMKQLKENVNSMSSRISSVNNNLFKKIDDLERKFKDENQKHLKNNKEIENNRNLMLQSIRNDVEHMNERLNKYNKDLNDNFKTFDTAHKYYDKEIKHINKYVVDSKKAFENTTQILDNILKKSKIDDIPSLQKNLQTL